MTDKEDRPSTTSAMEKNKDSGDISTVSKTQTEASVSHHIIDSTDQKSTVTGKATPAAATVEDNKQQADVSSSKPPRRSRKKKVPITQGNASTETTPKEINKDTGSIQPESTLSDHSTKAKRNRGNKATKNSKPADPNGEDTKVASTTDLDKAVGVQDKKKKKKRPKKKNGGDGSKNTEVETTVDGHVDGTNVETSVANSNLKKPKEKKKRQSNKKTSKGNEKSAASVDGVASLTTTSASASTTASASASSIATAPATTSTSTSTSAVTKRGASKVGKNDPTPFSTKEKHTAAPTMPSFNTHHQQQRRMADSSLPLEEIQFSELSQQQSTAAVASSVPETIIAPIAPRHGQFRQPPKPLATMSDNSAMPRRDRQKKLSSKSVLDPTLSLQNYFVPASKQLNESLETVKHDQEKQQQKGIQQNGHQQKDNQQNDHHQKDRHQKDHHQKDRQQNDHHQKKLDRLNPLDQSEHNGQQEGKEPNNSATKPKSPRKAKKERRMQRIKKAIEEEQQHAKQHSLTKQGQDGKQQTTGYVHRDDQVAPGRRQRYEPYMEPKLMIEAIENGTLYQGIVRINKRTRTDSYVTSDDLEYDIYIQGLRDRNRALEGDMVAVRLLNVDTIWDRKKHKDSQKNQSQSAADKNGCNVGVEIETDDEDNVDKNKPKLCGQVVGILHRMEGQQYTGTLNIDRHAGPSPDSKEKDDDDDTNDDSGPITPNNNHIRLLWLRPTDKRAPFIAIPVSHAPDDFLKDPSKYKNEIFAAKATRWPIDSQFPFGKLMSDIGPLGEMAVEAESILANNNIQDTDFSAKALKALPKTPWTIPEKEYKSRRDLRSERIFTIDPETAKDLDDALHITRLENQQYEVGVHIADVSYFLKRNTQLDVEAKDRGTSTYLVDRVIPMLPSLLCEQLCSLNPGVERLAFSVIWKMDSAGNILDTWFGRTIIKSCAKLAYDDAQSVIDKNDLPTTAKVVDHSVASVEQDILDLHKLSLCMRKRRYENGALSMNSIKLSFKLDDDGEPEKVWVYQLKEANRLIEEFMLRANMSVAEKICEHYPGEAMLRRHEPPIERRLDEFISVAQSLGYYIDGSTSGTLQASFDAIESEDVKYVLRILAIKPMRRAKYFCVGSFDDTSKYLHFALNVPMYTHFTSPIRRYADVIVHRQLESILQDKDECGYPKKTVQSIALQCNRKKDGAKNAQEQSGHLYLSRYLARLSKTDGPIIRDAIVLQVNSDVFDLLVPDYGLESRVYMDAMPLERFLYDTDDNSLVVFWKEDGVMNMDTIGKIREINKTANDKIDTAAEKERNIPENDSAHGTKSPENRQGFDHCQLETSSRMQKFKTFTKFKVLIQVNTERTPPINNIYPINPFLKK